jgi:Ca-activated chloride channel family protein
MRWIFPVLCLSGIAVAQDSPRIQVDVNLVNLAFTVRDPHGTLAAGLSRDDFEVLEDGVPQQVSFFARSQDVPLTLGLIADVSGSQEHFIKQHHHHLDEFLREVLGPRDRAFLVCFGNHLRLVSDFTPSSVPLMDSLNQFEHDRRHFPELGPQENRELGTAFYDALYYAVTEKLTGAEDGRRRSSYSATAKTIPARIT